MAPRTIDNLGVEVSTRYAQDQDYDRSIITDARVSGQTQIDVTRPSAGSELDQLLNLETKVTPWSSFQAPLNFYTQKRGLFSPLGICPSLGTEEKQESLVNRLQANLTPTKDESMTSAQMMQPTAPTAPIEGVSPIEAPPTDAAPQEAVANVVPEHFVLPQGVSAAEIEKQQITLLKMFTTTAALGKDLNRVISERNRYHKG